MRDSIVFYDYYGDHIKWYGNLIKFFEDKGKEVYTLSRNDPASYQIDAIVRSEHAFIWNGECTWSKEFKKKCDLSDVPYSIMEVGFFPQRDYFVLDKKGINATSNLMDSDLYFVQKPQLDRMELFRKEYVKNLTYSGKDKYTLVPLQLGGDTNIQNNSPYQTMQGFISHCESVLEGTILFKKHPIDCFNYKTKQKMYEGNKSFSALAKDASLVYGINSTCLLESLLQKVPTIAIGRGFITRHHNNSEKLLAALVEKQIPIDQTDFTFWLNRYSNYTLCI